MLLLLQINLSMQLKISLALMVTFDQEALIKLTREEQKYASTIATVPFVMMGGTTQMLEWYVINLDLKEKVSFLNQNDDNNQDSWQLCHLLIKRTVKSQQLAHNITTKHLTPMQEQLLYLEASCLEVALEQFTLMMLLVPVMSLI